MLLPLIGEGWDGEYPVRDLFMRHSEQRSVIQNPLQTPLWRHSVLDTESPASSEGFYSAPLNPSNYEIPGRSPE